MAGWGKSGDLRVYAFECITTMQSAAVYTLDTDVVLLICGDVFHFGLSFHPSSGSRAAYDVEIVCSNGPSNARLW